MQPEAQLMSESPKQVNLAAFDSCVSQPGPECMKGMVTTNPQMNTDLCSNPASHLTIPRIYLEYSAYVDKDCSLFEYNSDSFIKQQYSILNKGSIGNNKA